MRTTMGDGRPPRSGLTRVSTLIAPRRSGGLLPHPTASARLHASGSRRANHRMPALPAPPRGPRSADILDHPSSRTVCEREDKRALLSDTLAVLQDDDVLAAAQHLGFVSGERRLVDLQVDLVAPLDLV